MRSRGRGGEYNDGNRGGGSDNSSDSDKNDGGWGQQREQRQQLTSGGSGGGGGNSDSGSGRQQHSQATINNKLQKMEDGGHGAEGNRAAVVAVGAGRGQDVKNRVSGRTDVISMW